MAIPWSRRCWRSIVALLLGGVVVATGPDRHQALAAGAAIVVALLAFGIIGGAVGSDVALGFATAACLLWCLVVLVMGGPHAMRRCLWGWSDGPATHATPEPIATGDYDWDVFLAHASIDKPRARALHEALLRLLPAGRVFLDEVSIEPGTNWLDEITRALGRSAEVAVLVGPDFREGIYAQAEVIRAVERWRRGRAKLVPVLLERGVDVQFGLESIQAVPAYDMQPDEVAEILWRSAARRDATPAADARTTVDA